MNALQMQMGFHDFTNVAPDRVGQSSKAMQTKFVPSKNWTKNIVFFLSIICCKAITLSIKSVMIDAWRPVNSKWFSVWTNF